MNEIQLLQLNIAFLLASGAVVVMMLFRALREPKGTFYRGVWVSLWIFNLCVHIYGLSRCCLDLHEKNVKAREIREIQTRSEIYSEMTDVRDIYTQETNRL